MKTFLVTLSTVVFVAASSTLAAPPDPLAEVFGKLPMAWDMRQSPDGTRYSFLHMDSQKDVPIAVVLDRSGAANGVLASDGKRFDLSWCEWANNERLLCSYTGFDSQRSDVRYPITRLVATNASGQDMKVLLRRQIRNSAGQFHDNIINWLPDDPQHVLIAKPGHGGTGVARLNIYSGATKTLHRVRRNVMDWYADSRGDIRLRFHMNTAMTRWLYKRTSDAGWQVLRESPLTDLQDRWYPRGFGSNPDELFVLKPHGDTLALWLIDLGGNRDDEVIFSHPTVDVQDVHRMGKHRRVVAASYATDVSKLHFVDEGVAQIHEALGQFFPNQSIRIIDESWDERYYLFRVSSDVNPGVYYRLDTRDNKLLELLQARPELKDARLARQEAVSYRARDGATVPGYLTVPAGSERQRLPTLVLPHGGPQSRDVWGFDWLAQFLAAKGYAVLQSNFRGSGGFGQDWIGEGGFRAWQTAVNDLTDGLNWLIDEGITDGQRVCILGWSYGGYAALMSAIEHPELFKCTVSIAGVTDPGLIVANSRHYLNGREVREFIGKEDSVLRAGSPVKRANELLGPVLLFHGDQDLNVELAHSKLLHRALRKAGRKPELIVYDGSEHSIVREAHRQDMLQRIGEFLFRAIGGASEQRGATLAD